MGKGSLQVPLGGAGVITGANVARTGLLMHQYLTTPYDETRTCIPICSTTQHTQHNIEVLTIVTIQCVAAGVSCAPRPTGDPVGKSEGQV
jgi:hypothetical protein